MKEAWEEEQLRFDEMHKPTTTELYTSRVQAGRGGS